MRKIFILLLFLIFSCARPPLEKIEDALIKVTTPDELIDNLPLSPLMEGMKKNISLLKKDDSLTTFQFGNNRFTTQEYIDALNGIIEKYEKNPDKEFILDYIKNTFDFYMVYGRDRIGEVLLTSYFTPVIEGRKKPEGRFKRALYRLPKDLVEVKLTPFKEDEDYTWEKIPKRSRLFGRLINDGRDAVPDVVPFYSRKEIDREEILSGRKLEICYVDPVDAFFMQIQGSGMVVMKDGSQISLGYAGQNGRKYFPIGKLFLDKFKAEEITMEIIESHLKDLNLFDADELMFHNPSYVFFNAIKGLPRTTFGSEVIDGRIIATDLKFFPKGALAYLDLEGARRLVLDHDTGGAIKGGGRVDLYWGAGDNAKVHSGSMRKMAKLFYLAPKKNN